MSIDQVNTLLALAGVCEGGSPDLADNHDHYLSAGYSPIVDGVDEAVLAAIPFI